MSAVDEFLAGMPAISRSLNAVKTNGQAVAAADYAIVEAQNQIAAASFVRDGFFSSETYSGASIKRDLEGRLAEIRAAREQLSGAGSRDLLVSTTIWPRLRRAIEGVFIDAAPIYTSGTAKLQDIGADLVSTVGRYIEGLADDPSAALAKIAGDITRVVAHTARVAVEQASDIAKTEVAPAVTAATGGIFSVFGSLTPLLIVAGAIVAVYFLAPAFLAKKALA